MAETISGSARDYLRGATSALRLRIDQTAKDLRLDNQKDYRRFLCAHAAALLPLERELREAGIEDIVPDWAERVRGGELVADLCVLEGKLVPLDPPLVGCDATALGAAYVLENLRLGAGVLLKRVHPDFPVRYLRHGQGRRLWQRFVTRLEDQPSVRERPQAARAGAIAALTLFERAFRREMSFDLAVAAR